MPESTINALLIEDNPGDAVLIQETFAGVETVSVQVEVANTLSAGLVRLRQPVRIDVVLLDLNLPDSSGLDTLDRVREEAPDLPVVVMTALTDERLAKRAIEKGAQDYFVKGEPQGCTLVHSIRLAILRQGVQQFRKDTDEYLAVRRQTPAAEAGTPRPDPEGPPM